MLVECVMVEQRSTSVPDEWKFQNLWTGLHAWDNANAWCDKNANEWQNFKVRKVNAIDDCDRDSI